MKRCRTGIDGFRHLVRWYEPEDKLARDAQAYWDEPPASKRDLYAHWKSGFEDASTWQAIGRENFDTFRTFARSTQLAMPMKTTVEWGVGGGANALHFAGAAEQFYGVDITQPTLDECARQLTAAGVTNFNPVRIQVTEPESALSAIPAGCDAFVSFYVFELFPSPAYGVRILKIANQLLRPGGMAYIQIKYTTNLATRSRRWGYRFGVANMTTYRLDEFWETAKDCGFTPHAIHLMPKQPLVHDERYAYFAMTK
ncbi:class I SAM-dependent methyltransferase [Humisphaera borealis]|uniref:Class I SAM-dependent methyltransferase n=1 Tax=Humisphaera borealis TaxID=2807512 RepID=A0A7M2WXX9_9BACT|nr:class I SAM-dependent methyltransferase [Humisphaera borealis]QOV90335.1 class I SAM-dependent methyltransferase [Humisphaera borealis]